MIQIKDKIVSFDVVECNFICDLDKCKGICCVDGDSGAPLELEEIEQIEQSFSKIEQYLKPESLLLIKKSGFFIKDYDGDNVTPCNEDGSCVYLIKQDNIHICAFEKAFLNGEINFHKPISCHLYPIRLTDYKNFTAVNYEKRDICRFAVAKGNKENVKVYEFLKVPIIRKFGNSFYEELDFAAKNYKKQKDV